MTDKHRTVVVAWAEPASGPGWANAPIWYLERDQRDGSYHVGVLQPDEHTPEMALLYPAQSMLTGQLTKAVSSYLRSRK